MAHRDFNGGRSRNWTSETTDTLPEDGGVYVCPRVHPIRQPHFAPPIPREPLTTVDKGFARFLKKHASPTHQRVTAGGRIVPMEPRAVPPVFPLETGSTTHENSGVADGKPENYVFQANQMAAYGYYSLNGLPSMPAAHFPGRLMSPTLSPIPTGGVTMPAGASVDYNACLTSPVFSPMMYPTDMSPTFPQDQLALPASHMICPGYMPVAAPVGQTCGPYLMPHTVPMPWLPSEQTVAAQANPPLDGPLSLSHLVAQATKNFDMLDAQLKEHDRFRAMRDYDRSLSEQRRVIVEKRSNAKDLMDRLRAAAEVGSPSKGLESATLTTHGWNVNAPSYVPRSAEKNHHFGAFPAKFDAMPHIVDQNGGKMSRSARSQELATRILEEAAAANRLYTTRDDQHVKTPQRLSYEQNLVGRANAAEVIKHNIQESAVLFTPGLVAKTRASPHSSTRSRSGTRSSMLGSIASGSPVDLVFRNKKIVLPEARDDYKKYLDALRMPKGVSSYIQYHDGSTKVVEGIGLCRPSPSRINEWERKYWDHIDDEQRAQTLEARSFAMRGKENSTKSDNAFNNQFSLIEYGEAQRFREMSLGNNAGKEHVPHLGDGLDLDLSSLAPSKSSELTYGEAMANKTLSSVALQNVQAVSALPLNLDGTLESVQRRLREAVSESKAKSPRLLHRTTGGSSAWIGPYRREHQTSLATSDLERSPSKRCYY